MARQNQTDRIKLAEVNSIRYGLLNADEWREDLSNIITKKIEEFELTEANREQLQKQVQDLMYRLLDEVEQILRQDMGKIKQFLMDAFVDLDKLRENIPKLSEQLLNELSKPENKENIKQFILGKLDTFVAETFTLDEQNRLSEILEAENFDNKITAAKQLEIRISKSNRQLQLYSAALALLLIIVFLLNYFNGKKNSKPGLFFLLAVTLIFLVNGITVPMIDIEAKINRITFQLIGENIVFTEQVFFFQSKSILDVVWILISNGKIDMIFVGLLIFGFSVLFPVSKIICSYLTIQSPKVYHKNKLVRFFTYKSSKWSMADVFVVAIFMAFIGFNGIVGEQLEHLKDMNKYVEVLTTNGTNLKSGFYLFILFCISGLFLSTAIQKKLEPHSN